MAYYPYPTAEEGYNLTSNDGFANIFYYLNYVTNQWFSNMLLIAVWVLILIGFYKATDDVAGAFAVAGFGTFVVALLFWAGTLISTPTFAIVIGVMIIGVLVLLVDKKN